ncbi:HD domain-containing protein [Dyadobacter sp. 32]|uniref:HD domain-containing protein n=1 Tax=Dyadobacter sp. 32 TaxID=538966 RepID=UPI0011F09078
MRLGRAKQYILERLHSDLPDHLYYHGVHHVLDVLKATLTLAEGEQIREADALVLLQTAALYHDSGFIYTYKGHESKSCEIVRTVLPAFEYNDAQIDQICGMIMATKIPQSPQNHLEKILCDADLDYLGRADFVPIAQSLFEELKGLDMINDKNSWNELQVSFLREHRYWTYTARQSRDQTKQQHLESLLRNQ